MSTKSKEKVVAALRKLFRSSDKIAEQEGASGSTGSPSRRLLSRHRPDAVTPASSMPENSGTSRADHHHGGCFFKSKKSSSSGNSAQVRGDPKLKRDSTSKESVVGGVSVGG